MPAEPGAVRRSFQSNHVVEGRSATLAHGYLAVIDVLGVLLVSSMRSIQLINLLQLCVQTSLFGLLLVIIVQPRHQPSRLSHHLAHYRALILLV